MSMAMYRTQENRDELARDALKKAWKVIIGDFTPARLIAVDGHELNANGQSRVARNH